MYIFHLYGFFIGLGIVIGAWISEQTRKTLDSKHSIINASIYDVLPWVVIPGILGARLYHVIDYWSYYSQNLTEIFYLWNGGLGIYGGILGGTVGLGIYLSIKVWKELKKKEIKEWFHCFTAQLFNWLDVIAFGLPLGQAIGRIGNYFNQELYGLPTNLPWGIYINPENRLPGFAGFSKFHPLFAYEAIWDIIIFIILITIIKRKNKLRLGSYFFIYLGLYGLGRFFLEFLRINPWSIGRINVAQGISTGVILISLIFAGWRSL